MATDIEGKGCAKCICYSMMALIVLDLLWMCLLTLLIINASELAKNPTFQEEIHGDRAAIFTVVYTIVLLIHLGAFIIRCIETWKLRQSLQQCDTNPEQALRSLMCCRSMAIFMCSYVLFTFYFIHDWYLIVMALFEVGFIFGIFNFEKGLRNEMARLGIGLAAPGYMGLNMGYGSGGYGPPFPVASNVVYPMPPYMVPPNNEGVSNSSSQSGSVA